MAFSPDNDEYVITSRRYGKSAVKLLHVSRRGKVHTVHELEVDTYLTLTTQEDYTHGDNRDIVATDSQKNIVYVLAKKHGVSSPEEFALTVADFFLAQYSHVTEARVTVTELTWDRIDCQGRPHNHAYVMNPTSERFTTVISSRKGKPQVTSGLRNLRLLKTTQSAFVNFVSDEFRTLPDAEDRLFSTVVRAHWSYCPDQVRQTDFDKAWDTVKQTILEKFAGEAMDGLLSTSVQNTLYEAEKVCLDRVPQMSEISMDMPNKHYFAVDLTKFPARWVGKETNKTVFLPVDKPSGFIHATLARSKLSSKL